MLRLIIVLMMILNLTACEQKTVFSNRYPGFNSATKGAAVGAGTGAVIGTVADAGFPVGTGVGAVVGGAFGGAIGAYLDETRDQVQTFESHDIQFVRTGDIMTIIVPTGKYFNSKTHEPAQKYYFVLGELAQWLENMPKTKVKVAGFTDSQVPDDDARRISQTEAESFAKFLWDHGVDGRIVYGVGYGAQYPIATNRTTSGRKRNNRVEVIISLLTSGSTLS